MKKLFNILLSLMFLVVMGCNRGEEKTEGTLRLEKGQVGTFEGYTFKNTSDEVVNLNLIKEGISLNTTLVAKENSLIAIEKEDSKKDFVDEEKVKLLSKETKTILEANKKNALVLTDRNIEFPNELPSKKEFSESLYFNLTKGAKTFDIVAGFEDARFVEGKAALYLDGKLVYVNNNIVTINNGKTVSLEATFENNKDFSNAQMVFATVEQGETKYYASKISTGEVVVGRSYNVVSGNYPTSLPTNTSGITYKPAVEVKTWEKYTEDTPVYVGGVVYWTTQELLDTWAIYVDGTLAYEGQVVRSGSSMNMLSTELNMTAGTHDIQVVFGAMVNGTIAYGISDKKQLTIGAGSLTRGDLVINIAKPTFPENAFVPKVTVDNLTKEGVFGQSLTFDRLEAGKTYNIQVETVIIGAKTYRPVLDVNPVSIVKDTVSTVNLSYVEEATQTGILEVNIGTPTFAQNLFAPVITVNGLSKTGTWGGKVVFNTFLGGTEVKVVANAYANETHKYIATVKPDTHTIVGNGTVVTSVNYKEELKGSDINPDGSIVLDPPFAPPFNGKQRVIGYVPTWKPEADMTQIAWANTTHINIAFLEFDQKADGTFSPKALADLDKWVPQIVSLARANGNTVSIAVGGAVDYGFLWLAEKYKTNPELIEAAANNIIAFVDKYNLDGVDLDLECWWKDPEIPGTAERGGRTRGTDKWGGNVETGADPAAYGMTLLAKKLRAKRPNMLISAAVFATPWYGNNYDADVVNYLDWIGLMSYDFTGSWDKSPIGPHSALYEVASGYPGQSADNPIYSVETAMQYWTGVWSTWQGSGQNVTKDKIIVGLPFYGYDLSQKKIDIGQGLNGYKYIGYSDIVTQYPHAPTSYDPRDPYKQIGFVGDGGVLIYYDTPKAVAEKVKYAKRIGTQGTMIWELTQDLPGTDMNSLLNSIGKAYVE